MPCHGCGQAAESPAFPLRMHRIGAVAHKSSTCLCTDSRKAVLLPGWRAAADRPAGACVPGAARRAWHPGHAARCRLCRVTLRERGGARTRTAWALDRNYGDHLTGNLPAADGCEFYAFIGCCGHSCVGWGRTLISVRCGPTANRRLFELNLARLVRQAGKRCYRRRAGSR